MDAINVRNLSKKFKIPYEKRTTLFENLAGLIRGGFGYDEFWALKDISFDVKQGESFGIIGENGSGKTTLLSIIANVLRSDEGECKVKGRIAPFLGLGVGFEPELTAKENVYLYGSIMGLSKKKISEKYTDIVSFAELDKFMGVKLKNFSSGMYMRLAFAIAIHVDPNILLIDELLAVGDEAFQHKCIDRIKKFQEEGKTIVFVSHSLDTVQSLCKRSLLLVDGRIYSLGKTEKAIADYHDYLKQKTEVAARGEPQEPDIRTYGFKCAVCGYTKFLAAEGTTIREARCQYCSASKRISDVALTILQTVGFDENYSLMGALENLRALDIYEAQSTGILHNTLSSLPRYVCSEYFDGCKPGTIHASGVRCEDIESLSFPDESFDIIITQDVIEHIPHPEKAFAEIYRALKPGGSHIFTVPIHEGHATKVRANKEDGKINYLLPPVRHLDGLRPEGILLYTDWGDDLVDKLNAWGMPTQIAVKNIFYPSDEIPNIVAEDDAYLRYKNAFEAKDVTEILRFFLYNSLVFVTKKVE
ncbi:ATP-binding cassette domain-containing protein [Candidatus Altiarchaeota archaeon]